MLDLAHAVGRAGEQAAARGVVVAVALAHAGEVGEVDEHVGVGVGVGEVVVRADAALAEQGRGAAREVGDAAGLAVDDEPREARVQREAEHAAAERGELAVRVMAARRSRSERAAARAAAGGGSNQAKFGGVGMCWAWRSRRAAVRSARATSGGVNSGRRSWSAWL
jgi:hypothetical protein